MNMVERVARAIYEASPFRDTAGEYDEQSEIYRRMCRLFARAAIKAMREPTEKMLYHADGFTDLVGPYPEANTPDERRAEFGCAWEVMIDAALSE